MFDDSLAHATRVVALGYFALIGKVYFLNGMLDILGQGFPHLNISFQSGD